jgi:arsenate reductase
MDAKPKILFLCPHNAAKSVMAAAYCQRLAAQRGLDLRATSAGTEPDPAVSDLVVEALRAEGIDVSGHRPRRVTRAELAEAWHVVSMGCEVDDVAPAGTAIERWDDVPGPSQNLAGAREAIVANVARLLDRLAGAMNPSGKRGAS